MPDHALVLGWRYLREDVEEIWMGNHPYRLEVGNCWTSRHTSSGNHKVRIATRSEERRVGKECLL